MSYRERKREKFALGKNGQNQALSVRAPSLHFSRPSAAVQSRRALPPSARQCSISNVIRLGGWKWYDVQLHVKTLGPGKSGNRRFRVGNILHPPTPIQPYFLTPPVFKTGM